MSAPAALLLAAIVASGALDGARVALGHALGKDLLAGCTVTERAHVLRDADISTLGTLAGRRVVLANPHEACICGNVNCPYLVLALDPGGKADVLLSTFAYVVSPVGRALPLPNLRELAHDSNLISDETIDAFRNGTYVTIGSARVRSDNGARKANALPLRFAPGRSSAVVRGSVSLDWYDEYALAAGRGQRVTIGDVHAPSKLTFTLIDGTDRSTNLQPGVPAVLPAGGSYLLHVESDSEAAQAYRATVTIR